MRAIKNRWYVSVEPPQQWRPTSPRAPSARRTKAFPTEIEAKRFAKEMLSAGFRVTAGTLSPHSPMRRLVVAAEVEPWIEENE
jgi:hypothetical protein